MSLTATKKQELNIQPHSVHVELAVISGLLIGNGKNLLDVAAIISPEDFYIKNYGEVFHKILELEKKNAPIDLVTLADELNLEQEEFATLVENIKNSPSPHNILHYAKQIKDYSIRRNLSNFFLEMYQAALTSNNSAKEIFDLADQKMLQLSNAHIKQAADSKTIGEILPIVIEEIGDRYDSDSDLRGISTGFTGLDHITKGLRAGSLNIIAARPGMGKTTLATNIVQNVAKTTNHPTLFFSIEMANEEVVERMISSESKVRFDKIQTGNLKQEELQDIAEFSNKIKDEQVIFYSGGVGVNEIKRETRKITRKYGGVSLLVIDYIQLMKTSEFAENRTIAIAEVSRKLKQFAVDMKVPIIALSQLNRGMEQRINKKPVLSDLRDSGAIEQDADLIMFIHRENMEEGNRENVEIIIGKQRNGPTGNLDFKFIPELMSFEENKYLPS